MKIRFILVEPKVPENIGASARAIKTMGFDELVLVRPLGLDDEKARRLAHGSTDILERALVFDDLAKALEGSDISVATTAKYRSVSQDYVPSGQLGAFISGKTTTTSVVSIVFGREESGLTNEEIRQCDITSSVAMALSYPSLNLSQAVMIYAYELASFEHLKAGQTVELPEESLKNLKLKANLLLDLIGIRPADNRRGRIMERLSLARGTDLNLLHTVINLILERENVS
ncbi:MAG: tRNA/rRNA methyltransferase [Bacteroidales bacterium]